MRIIAVIHASWSHAPLAQHARLTEPIAGRTVLQHVLHRIRLIPGLDGAVLLCAPADQALAAAALAELGNGVGSLRIQVCPTLEERPRRRELIYTARRWNPDAWRGAPLGATWFDEYLSAAGVAHALQQHDADAALCIDGHQPLLDVGIAEQMIRHAREHEAEARFVFTQAPPGLAGIILSRQVLIDLLKSDHPVGLLLSYRPETPRADPIARVECVRVPPAVSRCALRFVADTASAIQRIRSVMEFDGADIDAITACRRAMERSVAHPSALPREVELELTTNDELARTRLRPRGARVAPRELPSLDHVDRLAAELATGDDVRIVLGGHGDPLLHPHFSEVLARIRRAGDLPLAVVTPLRTLAPAALEALFAHAVDIVQVQLDAASPETYQRVHQAPGYECVIQNVERILSLRLERVSARPLVIPSLTRCADTFGDLEGFFDGWIRRCGTATVVGYHDFGGRLEPDSLLPLTPPVRGPCRRLNSRLTLLASGQAVACESDVDGQQPIGNWQTESLTAIWSGAPRAALTAAHAAGDLNGLPLCARCGEWMRP